MTTMEKTEKQIEAEIHWKWTTRAEDIEAALNGYGTAAVDVGWLSLIGGILGGLVAPAGDGILLIAGGVVICVVLGMAGFAAKALANISECARSPCEVENSFED